MKPKSGATAKSTGAGATSREAKPELSECGRNFEEIFKEHHVPGRDVEREIKRNRASYGHNGL